MMPTIDPRLSRGMRCSRCGGALGNSGPLCQTCLAINSPQPNPVESKERPTWEVVIADMQQRDRIGRSKYGTALQPCNGRNSLLDAYQELLDLVVYLRNEIEERIVERERCVRIAKRFREQELSEANQAYIDGWRHAAEHIEMHIKNGSKE